MEENSSVKLKGATAKEHITLLRRTSRLQAHITEMISMYSVMRNNALENNNNLGFMYAQAALDICRMQTDIMNGEEILTLKEIRKLYPEEETGRDVI